MGWTHDAAPGHDGYLIALVRIPDDAPRVRVSDRFRELIRVDDAPPGTYLDVVQVGCDCGWRSPRLDAPIGTCWWPAAVEVPAHFEAHARTIWRAHAIATVHGQTATPPIGWSDRREKSPR